MNDLVNEPPATANSVAEMLAELERRVQSLETRVASLPDSKQVEERITERVKANVPPPVDPSQAPSFRDIELPIPNFQTMVATAKTTWAMVEMLNELKMLFWTLFDRRYHMAWLTRVITITLLAAILTSQFWLPFAFDNIIGHTWEKVINLLISFVMFFVLHYEMRRYQEWRSKR